MPAAQVALVTDSAACLPPGLAQEHAVIVVPLRLIADGLVIDDCDDIGVEPHRCTTARPTPARFETAYRQAAQDGATAVVSVHLPRAISGTIGSAELAAATAAVPVFVVDGQSIGLGLGLCVLAAAAAAAAGRSAQEVAAVVVEQAGLTRSFFAVDGTGVLLAGGRLGPGGSGQAAPVLFSRPVLELTGGRICLVERVRTRAAAAERLAWLAAEAAGDRAVDIAIQHYQAGQRAAELAERLRIAVPGLADLRVASAGAVLAAHAGPGMLGVAVAPHPPVG